MTFKSFGYDCIHKNLSDGDFGSGTVCAQLLSNGYNFSDTNTTRADISSFAVGSPIVVTGKSVTYSGKTTTYDSDNIPVTGSPSARYCAYLFWNGSASASTDKLLAVVDLNNDGAVDVLIDQDLQVGSAGLFQTTFSNA